VTSTELREARRERGWTQEALAVRLGVSQAYVCLLERGRRRVPRRLAERLVTLLELPLSALPVGAQPVPLRADEAPGALGALGYPGFAYVRGGRQLNPAELLLRVLRARDVDARVVEALPWMLLRYPNLDWPWLLRETKASDLQNRLGFLLGVARELAELRGEPNAARELAAQERALEGSRLQREDTFRDSMTEAERRWLRDHRPAQAAHWNVLSAMTAIELARAYRALARTVAIVSPRARRRIEGADGAPLPRRVCRR
jgi:transcriptional regulator with XRE-family HTH domain